MKHLIFSLFLTGLCVLAVAQTDSLQQYTGKYSFPEGSPVTEVSIVFEKGSLMAQSAMGNTELRLIEADVFEIVSFGGMATFRRSEEGKVKGVLIEVMDYRLEGTRTEDAFSPGSPIRLSAPGAFLRW